MQPAEDLRHLELAAQEELTVKVYEPDYRLIVRGGFAYFQGEAPYRLESLRDDTKGTNEVKLHAAGALDAPAALATLSIKGAVAQNLNILKELLERIGR